MTSQRSNTPDLDDLLVKTRGVIVTPADRRAQMISFVFGNTYIENPAITREMVTEAYDRLLSEGSIRSGH